MREYLEEAIPAAGVDLWPQVQRKLARQRRRRIVMRFASVAAAVMVLAGVGATWALWPRTASAQVILERAQAALASPAALRSFIMTERTTWQRDGDEEVTVIDRWYEAPNRWRNETWQNGTLVNITLNDGTNLWRYVPETRTVTISDGAGVYSLVGALSPFGKEAQDLAQVFEQAAQPGECLSPRVVGTETVAGREAYVLDLGEPKCFPSSAPDLNGRQTMWVDKETFLVLKRVYAGPDGTPVLSREVTNLQVGVDVPDEKFTFTPAEGMLVYDAREKPAPSVAEFQAAMQAAAAQADFPLYVPRAVPAGLRPGAPMRTPAGIEVGFDPDGTTSEGSSVLMIQRKATATDVARDRPGEEPLLIGGDRAWFLQGGEISGGGRLASGLTLIRGGTLISLTSFALDRDALIQMANSLYPVPGGHAPLPDPVAMGLAELRGRVAYPVLVPTFVPDGLTPGEPEIGAPSTPGVRITYRSADGAEGLSVLNAPAGCCLDADGRKNKAPVTIRGGVTAYYLGIEPQFGGPILWWNENGAYVALSGPNLTRDDLIRVAESMSATADLE